MSRPLADLFSDKLVSLVAEGEGDVCRIRFYDRIGNVPAALVAALVDAADSDPSVKRIEARFNSEGGAVKEGMGIYSALVNAKKPVDTYVDGVALSMASLLAQANTNGGKRYMARNARLMLHSPRPKDHSIELTDADKDMISNMEASMIETYAGRTGNSASTIQGWFASGDKWFNAAEAKAAGLCDEVFDNGLPALKAESTTELVAEAEAHLTPPTTPTEMDNKELQARLEKLEAAQAQSATDLQAANARAETAEAALADTKTKLVEATGKLQKLHEAKAKEVVASAAAAGKIKADAVGTWEAKAIADLEGTSALLESIEAAKGPGVPPKRELSGSAPTGGTYSAAGEQALRRKEQAASRS